METIEANTRFRKGSSGDIEKRGATEGSAIINRSSPLLTPEVRPRRSR
jgi:hypothetical protein